VQVKRFYFQNILVLNALRYNEGTHKQVFEWCTDKTNILLLN